MKRFTIAKGAAVLAAVALTMSACSEPGGPDAGVGATDSELVIAASVPTPKWDPALMDWGFQLQAQQAAYDTLIHLEADGAFGPGLATEWEYVTPTSFSMNLREGVTFSDGADLDAEAVKANIERSRDAGGPKANQLSLVDSVSVDGPLEVTVHLSAPNPSLPFVFAQNLGMMASPDSFSDEAGLAAAPVGAGPYLYDSANSIEGDHYAFTKNPDYWNVEAVGYEKLLVRVMADDNAIYNAVRAGEVDMGRGTAQTVDAAEAAGVNVLEYPGGIWAMLLLDREGTIVPALGDVRVRQAMNYAIDREPVTESVLPGRATSQSFGPATDAYDPELDDYYTYDPEKAKELLAEAGYPDGFEMPILSTDSLSAPLQAMVADLAAVGITVTIENKPNAEYVTARTSTDFPAYFGGNTPTNAYLDAQNQLMPTGALNPFKVVNDDIVGLIEKGAAEDDATRADTYKELSKTVLENAWYVVLEQITVFYYFSDDVEGVQATKGQIVPFIDTLAPAGS